jgi:hypothetical protein
LRRGNPFTGYEDDVAAIVIAQTLPFIERGMSFEPSQGDGNL